MSKVNRGKSISPALKYLRKEIRHELLEMDRRRRENAIDPKAHQFWFDALTFVQRRIDVAVLIEKDFISQTRNEARKEEEQRWINQPANEHDNRIKEHILREIMEEMPKERVMDIENTDTLLESEYHRNGGWNDYLDQVNTLLESKLSTVKKR